jgi:hypothetical protein
LGDAVAEGQLGAMLVKDLGDAPGNGAIIGHSKYQRFFAFQQLHNLSLPVYAFET